MKKKHKITLIVVGILLCLSLVIASSYAYYVFSVSQSGTNVVRSDCFEITYSDSNAINITDTIPLTDKEAEELTPYTFTINNICNSVMEYNVNIETLNTSTIDLNAIATKIDTKAKKVLGTVENNDSSVIVNNNISSSKTVFTGIIKGGESKTHNLRLWVDESATIEQSANKSFQSKVVVVSYMHTIQDAKLVIGKRFNSIIKKLAGADIDVYGDNIEDYRESFEQDKEYYSSLSENEFQNYMRDEPPGLEHILDPDFTLEDYAYIMLSLNTYDQYIDYNINSIMFADNKPDGVESRVVSTDDSSQEVVAWYDNGTIYLYPEVDQYYLYEDASYMFSDMSNLNSLDLSHFDTSNVTNMSNMFIGLGSLSSIDVSNFDTSNVTNMSNMFQGLGSLSSIDVSNFNTSNVNDMSGMFYGMENLSSLDVSNFNTSNVWSMSGMFCNMNNLISLDLSNFDTSKVTEMYYMFGISNYRGSEMTSLNVSSFNTSNVWNMSYMFYGLNNLTSLNVSSFNTSKVDDMSCMFGLMSGLTSLDITNFDTSKVKAMSYMFSSLSLNSIDLSHFNTSNVTDMSGMFSGTSFNSLDLSNFNTSKVTDMAYTFKNMTNITSLDLSNFDTSKVTAMVGMFENSNNLKTIYVGNSWSTSKVTYSGFMFKNDTNLVGGSGTTYDANHVDKAYAHVDGGTSNPGYFTLKTN